MRVRIRFVGRGLSEEAGARHQEYEEQYQGTDDVVRYSAPGVSPDEHVPERSTYFCHLCQHIGKGNWLAKVRECQAPLCP